MYTSKENMGMGMYAHVDVLRHPHSVPGTHVNAILKIL